MTRVELFGPGISEGAIANSVRRMEVAFDTARAAIEAKLLTAPAIVVYGNGPVGGLIG